MFGGYMDVDTNVVEAIEKGDFQFARAIVADNDGCLSRKDRSELYAKIREAESAAKAVK